MCENWGSSITAKAEETQRRRQARGGEPLRGGSRDKETHVRDRERGTVKSERGQPSILPSSCIHVQQTGLSHTLGGSVCCRDTEPYSLVMNPAFSQNAWNLTSPFNTFRVKWTCYGAPGQKTPTDMISETHVAQRHRNEPGFNTEELFSTLFI